jgi:hypothetical protein
VAGDGEMRKTNPICRRRAGKTIVKARDLGNATPQTGNCVKQTQSGGSAGAPEGEICKTNPISPAPGRRGQSIVPNKANSVSGSRESSACRETSYGGVDMHGTSAKQSQFARWGRVGRGPRDVGRAANAPNEPNFGRARYPSAPLFYHFTIPIRCLSCETNPIPGCAGRDEGQMRQTKPNLGAPGTSGGRPATEGQWRRTNPTLRLRIAKRSQLPEAGHRGGVRRSSRSDGYGIRRHRPATRLAGPPRAMVAAGGGRRYPERLVRETAASESVGVRQTFQECRP